MTLLIADDSELIINRLPGFLKPIPGIAAIHVASTLAQTLESVRQSPPSLLILDLHLPDGNAIQIISPIKQLTPAVRIAIFTNDANAFTCRKCLDAGADWFFDKSTELKKLLDVVHKQAALH